MAIHRPTILLVLDGWGHSEEKKGNPIKAAKLPTIDKLDKFYPKLFLQASGISVGLSWGEPGNSEVGHQALGSGQILYQNLPRIQMAVENGTFFKNPALNEAIDHAKTNSSSLHLIGLLSDGGVHSHIDHLLAILELAKEKNVPQVYIHAITDGRDTSPASAEKYLRIITDKISRLGIGRIATLAGRYYTMDRNENWDRIKKGYDAMVTGEGIKEQDPLEAIQNQYKKEVYDEYLEPVVICNDNGVPMGNIQKKDSVFFFNFREDRARQIAKALAGKDFDKFPTPLKYGDIFFASMTQYEKEFPEKIAFPPQEIATTLGKTLSENDKTQLRLAETEKYAHVTYFFNAGKEKAYPGEERILVPSKNAPSYDTVPEMSSMEITDKLLEAIESDKYDFILVNYAAPDMVGHTGNFDACLEAIEIIDECLAKIIPATLMKDGCLLITADHGNVEEVLNLQTGERNTEHSVNPVPCWLVTAQNHREKDIHEKTMQAQGLLCDVAPTILDIMQIPQPKEMICRSLLPLLK